MSRTIRVGMIDLDTSHSELFADELREVDGLRVAAVWDGGSVHAPGWASEFAERFGVERACATLEELVASVDVGMVMGQNWDLHVERARPFLEAGKRVFFDKPIVGRLADVDALIELSRRTGVAVMGGSSLRYAPQFEGLRRRVAAGDVVSAFASGPHDRFNYGTHAAAMLGGVFGPGIRAVAHVGGGESDLFLVEHSLGIPIVLQLSAPDVWEYTFHLAVTTRAGVETVNLVCDDPASELLNDALLGEFLRFARGEPPHYDIAEALEEVTLPLAAAESKRTARRVALDEIPAGAGFDGTAFTRDYAIAGGWVEGAGGGKRQPSSVYAVDGVS